MIKTLDNKTVKRGGRVWEIGVDSKGVYRPTSSIVHGGYNSPTNPNKTWFDYDLCKKECDKLNAKTK